MRPTRVCIALLLGTPPLAAAAAQEGTVPPIVGRWDITAQGPRGSYPSWLEVSVSGFGTLVGRFVGQVGSSRPISHVLTAGDTLRFAIPPQWQREPGDLRVEAVRTGDRLTGTFVNPDGSRHTWTAVRAPSLKRTAAPAWGTPVALFDGKSLAGWTTVPGSGENKWTVANGLLTAGGGGANLVTTRKFGDFKLHAEFRLPTGSNSGIYLRGRYEVQIEEDEGRGEEPRPIDIGGVYGFLSPNENAARAPNEWQTYDITLVGRRVTVVLNGHTVIADQIIPGITGGALDSDEGTPGPIYLQGDHGKVEFRKVVITPAR
ncbi:MAG: DUF1080 domain-containing protein [Gemmatirosa sp.]|nr:DUF1080 domain-containing protein [Gemmatirosa sp.]